MRAYRTTADVATALRVSEETVRGYVRDGVIPVAQRTPGGHARFDLPAVLVALDLQPRVRRLRPLGDDEIRLGAGARSLGHGSITDDLRMTAAELVPAEAEVLPTWPGVPGTARITGSRPLVEA